MSDEVDAFILTYLCLQLFQLVEINRRFVEVIPDDVVVLYQLVVLVDEDWHCCC